MAYSKYWIGFEVGTWALRASDGSLVDRFETDEAALLHALKVIAASGLAVSSVIHSADKRLVSIHCQSKDAKGGGPHSFKVRD